MIAYAINNGNKLAFYAPLQEKEKIAKLPFEEIYQRYYGRVYRTCLRILNNFADAEDLTQEIFLQVQAKLNTFRGESSFATWLHRITINHVFMYF
ncbi:MAG: RNA polymerase sigma factor, partial [Acidobacteriota bacterium]